MSQNKAKHLQEKVPVEKIHHVNKALIITQLIINVFIIVGAIVGGYFWLKKSVADAVGAKLQIYSELMSANFYNEAEQFDQSIFWYKKCFEELRQSKDPMDTELLSFVSSRYLEAIANSKEPAKHLGDYNAILTVFSDKEGLEAGAWNYVGWFNLRTGNIQQARTAFNEMLNVFNSLNDRFHTSVAHWGLCYVELADGNATAALSHLNTASDEDPVRFNEFVVDANSGKNPELARLYPDKFLRALNVLNKKLDASSEAHGPSQKRAVTSPH